jgi:hypothetical protein
MITAPLSGWQRSVAYKIDPTDASTSGNLVTNSGNLYQCIQDGTSAGSGGPSGTLASNNDGTTKWKYLGSVPSMSVLSGSQIVGVVARGTQSGLVSGSAGIPPWDIFATGSFTTIVNSTYSGFPDSFLGAFYRTSGIPASTGTYKTLAQWASLSPGGGTGDEQTSMWVELQNVRLGAPHTSSVVERASATNGVVQAATITTTKKCLIVSIWGGNGNVITPGTSHTAVPLNGLTLISGCVDLVSLSSNGYIQVAMAWRIATSSLTPFAEQWQTGAGSSEGAQLITLAFEDTSLEGSGSITDGSETLSSAGSISNVGSAAITDGSETLSSAGSISIAGSFAITDGSEALVATGGSPALSGSGDIPDASESLSSVGSITAIGSASITLGADSLTSSGSISNVGSGSLALANDTLGSAGSVSNIGSGSLAIGSDSSAASAASSIVGASAIVIGDETTSGVGFTGDLPDQGTEPRQALMRASQLIPRRSPMKIRTIRIEDIDRGMKQWFERVVDARVQSPQGDRRAVAVRFSAGERWVAATDRRALRDRDGKLILPILQISRVSVDPTRNISALGTSVPRMRFATLVSEKTSDLQNLDQMRPLSSRRIMDSAVYDVFTVPFPLHNTVSYEVSIVAQYQHHMNEIVEKVESMLDFTSVPSFTVSLSAGARPPPIRAGLGSTELGVRRESAFDARPILDDYYVVAFIRDRITNGGTATGESTDQEQLFETKMSIEVSTVLMLDPEGERPAVQVERTAFGISFGGESVHVVDDPADIDRIFGRKK